MKLTFIGAAHEVTGSCTFVEACGKKFLVDFGMEQGEDVYENVPIPVAPADIDFVLLTHAHIDHSGLLPLLYAGGFTGQIHSTTATANLCEVMLRDSAHIQEFEAEWRNRKGERKGEKKFVPLYTMDDAIGAVSCFVPHKYNEVVNLFDGITIKFIDAGHLLGSSSIEITLTENGETRKIVFSGDIGNTNQPLIRDPQYINEADYVVMESTYGTRIHDKPADYVTSLTKILQTTFDRGGSVIIPSFAVGRTQEMLYFIRKIKEDSLINGHDDFPVYVDSPLAIEATNIFINNRESCFDDEALEYVRKGINPIGFKGLITSVTSDDSREINNDNRPKVIISASGMCEAGRIKHHLKHNLWRPECTILFVGYQAVGTTGRAIVEGAKEIKLFGEPIQVSAEIAQLPGTSGHADREGLVKWINSFEKKPQKVFIVHGEDSVCDSFAALLHDAYGYDTLAPYTGAVYDLAGNVEISHGNEQKKSRRTVVKRNQGVFARLVAAGQRLMTVITHNEGGANKDLAKFADQINALCDKWDR